MYFADIFLKLQNGQRKWVRWWVSHGPNNVLNDDPQVEANNAKEGGFGSSHYPTWEEWQEWQRNDPNRFNNLALFIATAEQQFVEPAHGRIP